MEDLKQELTKLKEEVDTVKDRVSKVEDKLHLYETGVWALEDSKVLMIKNELNDIKISLNTIKETEAEMKEVVDKVENDFYDNGRGLKYDLINMLHKFDALVISVNQMVTLGKWTFGILGGSASIVLATVLIWFFKSHWK